MASITRDKFFIRRRQGLDVKARDLVLRDPLVKMVIIYGHGDQLSIFRSHPHLSDWPFPMAQLLDKTVSTTDMTTHAMTREVLERLTHWQAEEGLPSAAYTMGVNAGGFHDQATGSNSAGSNINSHATMIDNGTGARHENSVPNPICSSAPPSQYIQESTFGNEIPLQPTPPQLDTNILSLRQEDMGEYVDQDNYFDPSLFDDQAQAQTNACPVPISNPGSGSVAGTPTVPIRIKQEFNSDEEENLDEEDEDNYGDEEDYNDDIVFPHMVGGRGRANPYTSRNANTGAPQSYDLSKQHNSPKRRRVENEDYISEPPHPYMGTISQRPVPGVSRHNQQASSFTPINPATRRFKQPPQLRHVQSTGNIIQRPQLPQARPSRNNKTGRINSFDGTTMAMRTRARTQQIRQQ